jgi:hypothetical protein
LATGKPENNACNNAYSWYCASGIEGDVVMANENKTLVYTALKAYGFSPAKAAEIELDFTRGDKYAAAFVDLAIKAFTKETSS